MRQTLRHTILCGHALILAAFVGFSSCSKDATVEKDGIVEIELMAPSISVRTMTTRSMPVEGTTFPWQPRNYNPRATAYQYPISLWICEKGTYSPHQKGYCNKCMVYIPSSVAENTHWCEEDYRYVVKSLPAYMRKSIDVYAYYPYQGIGDLEKYTPENIPFTTEDQKDWMWADKITLDDIAPDSPDNRLAFTFHHAMTCLEVRLSTLYDGEITLNHITLSDAKEKLVGSGTMDIRNGALAYTADRAELTIKADNFENDEFNIYQNLLPTKGEGSRSYCFLMPQKDFDAGELTMTFFFDADEKPCRVSFVVPNSFKDAATGVETDVAVLETGKRYIMNLVIDNGLKITPVKFSKEDWTTVDVDLKL